MTKEAEKTKH